MKKTPIVPILISVGVTFFSTVLLFGLAEYTFHIPSRLFLVNQDSQDAESHDWTPRPIVSGVLPAQNPLSTGSITPGACTMEYAPVCGSLQVQCFRAPCEPIQRTFSNACIAKSYNAEILYTGDCRNEKTSTGITSIRTAISGESIAQAFDSGSYSIYVNASFGYAVAIPKFAYFQGIGSKGGISHTLAIGLTQTGAENIDLADVQVYFYKTLPSDLPPGGQAVQVANGALYVVQKGTGPKVEKIVQSILQSAQ